MDINQDEDDDIAYNRNKEVSDDSSEDQHIQENFGKRFYKDYQLFKNLIFDV